MGLAEWAALLRRAFSDPAIPSEAQQDRAAIDAALDERMARLKRALDHDERQRADTLNGLVDSLVPSRRPPE